MGSAVVSLKIVPFSSASAGHIVKKKITSQILYSNRAETIICFRLFISRLTGYLSATTMVIKYLSNYLCLKKYPGLQPVMCDYFLCFLNLLLNGIYLGLEDLVKQNMTF